MPVVSSPFSSHCPVHESDFLIMNRCVPHALAESWAGNEHCIDGCSQSKLQGSPLRASHYTHLRCSTYRAFSRYTWFYLGLLDQTSFQRITPSGGRSARSSSTLTKSTLRYSLARSRAASLSSRNLVRLLLQTTLLRFSVGKPSPGLSIPGQLLLTLEHLEMRRSQLVLASFTRTSPSRIRTKSCRNLA